MPLPAEIFYGEVRWHALAAVADTIGDVDAEPDAVGVTGTVTFTPSVSEIRVLAGADPVTIFLKSVKATVLDGIMEDAEGNPTVTLVSPESSTTPDSWQWIASFSLSGIEKKPIVFDLPAGEIKDLTALTPVAATTGTQTLQGPAGPAGPEGPEGPAGVADDASVAGLLEDVDSDTVAALYALTGGIIINHGADANMVRPTVPAGVKGYWFGTVEPVHADDTLDTYIPLTEA